LSFSPITSAVIRGRGLDRLLLHRRRELAAKARGASAVVGEAGNRALDLRHIAHIYLDFDHFPAR
jgi:hypothetical protein